VLRQAQHERFWGEHTLTPHTDTPAKSVRSVTVEIRSSSRHSIGLHYCVTPAHDLVVPGWGAGPIDGLWRGTCFEMFVGSANGPEYVEFNFAPHSGWAAYAFTAYRSGMRELQLDRPPRMVDGRDEGQAVGYPAAYDFWVYLDRDSWPGDHAAVALTAVIEEIDGTKSYWSLAHPPGAPDFHHPDCFALKVPAVGNP